MANELDAYLKMFSEVKKVREALKTYCLAPDKVPVSRDDIGEAILQHYNIKIKSRLVPINTGLVHSIVEIYPDNAIISIASNLNTSMTRYAFVKEVCHIMIINGDNITIDPGDIIEYFVLRQALPEKPEKSAVIISEEVTMSGAIELLFPFDLRMAAKDRIANGDDTLFTTAEWLEIPEFLVEFALSEKYHRFSEKIWSKI